MGGNYHGVKVTNDDLRNGFFPAWRSVCLPDTWVTDASHFMTSNTGAYATLHPDGRLTYEVFHECFAAPEFQGVIHAVSCCPKDRPSTVITDQLSIASIMHGGFSHAIRLSHTVPLWKQLIELLEERDVTLKWVRGHGMESSAAMQVVDIASRKAARLHFHDSPLTNAFDRSMITT